MDLGQPLIAAVTSLCVAILLLIYLYLSARSKPVDDVIDGSSSQGASRRLIRSLSIVIVVVLTGCVWLIFLLSQTGAQPTGSSAVAQLKLPPGFVIEVYVRGVRNARQMALGDNGTLFIGTRREGKVYAVRDSDGDTVPDLVQVIGDDLAMPAGVAFRDGDLYVAEVDKVWRYPDIEASLPRVPRPELVYAQLPNKPAHGWKYIAFGPDGHLYIPIGAPCNVCVTKAPYARIVKVDLEKKVQSDVALGVRNSVGFDWHPVTGALWFSDNGRDHMGDDVPDDEINVVLRSGQHFGFPYLHAGTVADPVFGVGVDPADYQSPAAKLGAHVAPLGIHFYRGSMFPERYRHALFVAEHGSWNRSSKVGYQVNVLTVQGDEVIGNRPFITGWLSGQSYSGRPVAFLELDDGSLLLSDDHAGVVYRISYRH